MPPLRLTPHAAPLRWGDAVRLRSGGPRMLIVDVHANAARLVCAWIGLDGSVYEASFLASSLRLVCVGHRSG